MSLTKAPKGAIERPAAYRWDLPAAALSNYTPLAAEADDGNTISIYDIIGEDFWTGAGFTAKRAAAALRAIGPNPVTVNINSPGGDMFEGLAIYNILAEHPAKVTIKVMGIAASAASVIAMAGDEILMGNGTMLMIHRAWGLAVGNSHDFADASALFAKFDEAMAEIYVERTDLGADEVMSLLDGATKASDGTFMTVSEAIEKGFADGKFEKTEGKTKAELPGPIMAKRRIETALAKLGVPRKERSELIKELSGTSDTAGAATRDAGEIEQNDEADKALEAIKAALVSNKSILIAKG